MTEAELQAILPLMILAGAAVVALLSIAIRRSQACVATLALAGLAAAGATLPFAVAGGPRQVTLLLRVDPFAGLFTGLVLAATAAVVLMSCRYLESRTDRPAEFHVLLLVGALGAVVLAYANHFASLFLGLETLSIALYGLVGYTRDRRATIEAGLKYLVLAGGSSAFLLMGMALVYAEVGVMRFDRLADAAGGTGSAPAWSTVGYALMVVGLGFKLALVPFHMWTPDVYQGAPAPAAAFIATVSKGAVFAVLLRLFGAVDFAAGSATPGYVILAVVAGLSMVVGNLLALRQDNLKRLLAYSSIAHLGYLMIAFLAAGPYGVAAAGFYLAAYFATVLLAFAVITACADETGEAGDLSAYHGGFWTRPPLAAALALAMLSLAGIPLTAGFFAKVYLIRAGASSARWLLLALLVVTSVIGLFYYLRVILTLAARPASARPLQTPLRPALSMTIVLAALVALVLGLGLWPAAIDALIGPAARSVGGS